MKTILYLVFKNAFRYKRNIFAFITLALATAVLLFSYSYIEGIFESFYKDALLDFAHVSLQTKDFDERESILPLNAGISNADEVEKRLVRLPNIKKVLRRNRRSGSIVFKNKKEATLFVSIRPTIEKGYTGIESYLYEGRYFSGASDEVILGKEIADSLGVETESRVNAFGLNSYGTPVSRRLYVRAIADFGIASLNKRAYISEESFNALFEKDDLPQQFLIILKNRSKSEDVLLSLKNSSFIKSLCLVVFTAEEKGIYNVVLPTLRLILNMVLFFFFAVIFIHILNTTYMNVFDRKREIGTLSAMGMNFPRLSAILILENFVLSFTSSFVGCLAGFPISYYFMKNGISVGETVARGMPVPIRSVVYAKVDISSMLLICLSIVGVSVLAASIISLKTFTLPINLLSKNRKL